MEDSRSPVSAKVGKGGRRLSILCQDCDQKPSPLRAASFRSTGIAETLVRISGGIWYVRFRKSAGRRIDNKLDIYSELSLANDFEELASTYHVVVVGKSRLIVRRRYAVAACPESRLTCLHMCTVASFTSLERE